jgi:inosine-uridine nucleoside N-ribohydrolase
MGGAVDVPGNVGPESGDTIPNYVAEWNLWVDPHAADIVFTSGIRIVMVPLDATNQVPQTQDFLDSLEGVMKTPEALLLYNMTTPGLYFWDQLTVVSLTNPEVITVYEAHCIEIVVELENHEGQSNSTEADCANAIVAKTVDSSAFEYLFVGYINDDLPSTTTSSATTTTSTTTSTTTTTTTNGSVDSLIMYSAIGGFIAIVLVIGIVLRRR